MKSIDANMECYPCLSRWLWSRLLGSAPQSNDRSAGALVWCGVVLAAKETVALPDVSATLICLEGELWLTRDGDVEDYVVHAGQHFPIQVGDKVAVQALRASRIGLK